MNDTFPRAGGARQSWLRWWRMLAAAPRATLPAAACSPVGNDNSGGGQGRRGLRPWRAAAAVAALAAAALLAAGCGSPAAGSAGSSPYQKALPFAQCMRSHGIANFPDPDSSGNFDTGNIPASPQYDAAQRTCVKLHPYNMVLSPQQQSQQMARALKYAQCMRAHGVANFPDPTQSNGGIAFGGQTNEGSSAGSGQGSAGSGNSSRGSGQPSGGSSAPPETPQRRAASQACQQYAGRAGR